MKKISKPLIFGVVFFVLSFAITLQLRLTALSESTASQDKISAKLKDEIFSLNNENDKLLNKLEKSDKDLEEVRDKAAERDSESKQKSDLIKKYTALAGYTDVSGEGIVIKYYPNKDTGKAEITEDLIDIVNELKNAGAEAIAVNNIRLVDNSSIELEKDKIVIDKTELNSTYSIKAIGNSETMNSSLIRPGGTIDLIRGKGIKIDLIISKKVSINKYSEIQ